MKLIEPKVIRKNHLTVYYDNNNVSTVTQMCLEHYDTAEYDNSIIFINCLPPESEFEIYSKYKLKIYYQLEHIQFKSGYRQYLLGVFGKFIDVIWEFELSNISVYPRHLYDIIKFKPLRYTSCYEDISIPVNDYLVDFLFIGAIDHYRPTLISELMYEYRCPYKLMLLYGKSLKDSLLELSISKHYLDIPRLPNIYTQNQVRIFEALLLNKSVVSTRSTINYFGDLITEIDFNDLFDPNLVIPDKSDVRSEYKKLTYMDKDYMNYCRKLKSL